MSPSRKEVSAIVEANKILETTPEIRSAITRFPLFPCLKYSSEWSKRICLSHKPPLPHTVTLRTWDRLKVLGKRISSLMGDGDYPYELVNTMVFERANQTIILDHAYSIVTNLLRIRLAEKATQKLYGGHLNTFVFPKTYLLFPETHLLGVRWQQTNLFKYALNIMRV